MGETGSRNFHPAAGAVAFHPTLPGDVPAAYSAPTSPVEPLFPDCAMTALVIADRTERAIRLSTLVGAMGGRLLATLDPVAGGHRLDRIVAVDLVLLDLTEASQEGMALLDRLAAMTETSAFQTIVITAAATLDPVFAAIDGSDIGLLCAPDDAELILALRMARQRCVQEPVLHDIGREDDLARLRLLSEEVSRIARALSNLTGGIESGGGADGFAGLPGIGGAPEGDHRVSDRPGMFSGEPPSVLEPFGAPAAKEPARDRVTARDLREMLRQRRLRDQFFPSDLFADPAWDMLLDLMAARLSGERVSVSSLCIAAAVPPTTALRWIRQLTDRGVFERKADPVDGRRIFIALSDSTAEAMAKWFAASRRGRGHGLNLPSGR